MSEAAGQYLAMTDYLQSDFHQIVVFICIFLARDKYRCNKMQINKPAYLRYGDTFKHLIPQ